MRQIGEVRLQEVGKSGVYLNCNDTLEAFGKESGQGPRARPDLHHNLVGARVGGLYDLPGYRGVLEKVLTQGFFGSDTGALVGFSPAGRDTDIGQPYTQPGDDV